MYKKYLTVLSIVLVSVTAHLYDVPWEDIIRNKPQATYGARNLQIVSSTPGVCTLPPYPENGGYSVGGQASVNPGDELPAAQIQVSCHPGYQPLGNHMLFCAFGNWSDSMPQCVRYCQLNPHPSVKYLCQVDTDDLEDRYYRECQNNEPSGTTVKPKCREPNYRHSGVLSHMRCLEGRWNYIAVCQPECGLLTPEIKTMMIGGQDAKKGEFPWHAAVYRKDFTPYKLICGGSLISRTIIISAAHCFWDKTQNQLRPNTTFAVALGKFYRGWDNPLDGDAQKFDVANIKVPVRYQGAISNYQDDIAIVWLSTPAQYRPYIRPVCLDFDDNFELLQLKDGNFGKVAGWGIKDQEGNPSPTLQVIDLPYVRTDTCIEESPSSFRPYITSDKICAGYTNGSAVCQGDSGGGLVFVSQDHVVERYYLRGIVSTAPETEAACNVFARTSFTKITKHRVFIEMNTLISEETTTVTQEPDVLCVLPPYPNNGSYSMVGLPGARLGQGYYWATLVVNCDHGFEKEPDSTPWCSFGRWNLDMPQCVPARTDRCRRPADWGPNFKCSDDFSSPQRKCNQFEPIGTTVTHECSSETYLNVFNRSITSTEVARCTNGTWEGDLSCAGDKSCGLVTLPEGSELPWAAIIYKKKQGQKKEEIATPLLICGATIVNNMYIITAAHCVWDSSMNSTRKASEFVVAGGKFYPKYDDPRDNNTQTSEVSEIIVAKNYNYTTQENDIALISLRKRLEYNSYVRPACIDWALDARKINDAVAKTASWKMSSPDRPDFNDKAFLRSVAVKIIDKEQCLKDTKSEILSYLTPDKICANDIAGLGVCAGDSGLGLVYPVRGRYFLLGVVSGAQSDDPCSTYQAIVFSSVYYIHTHFS